MSDARLQILPENLESHQKLTLETLQVLSQDIAEMKPQVALIPQMAADIETIKAVQTDQGHEIRHVERYLTTQGMPARA